MQICNCLLSRNYGTIGLDYLGSVSLWGSSTCLHPHTDNFQKPAKTPEYLIGEVTQLSESLLSNAPRQDIKKTLFINNYK